jgi:hypothetical protein
MILYSFFAICFCCLAFEVLANYVYVKFIVTDEAAPVTVTSPFE